MIDSAEKLTVTTTVLGPASPRRCARELVGHMLDQQARGCSLATATR